MFEAHSVLVPTLTHAFRPTCSTSENYFWHGIVQFQFGAWKFAYYYLQCEFIRVTTDENSCVKADIPELWNSDGDSWDRDVLLLAGSDASDGEIDAMFLFRNVKGDLKRNGGINEGDAYSQWLLRCSDMNLPTQVYYKARQKT